MNQQHERGGAYSVILADPPWSYRVWSTPQTIVRADGSQRQGKRVAAAHYETLSHAHLKALPVADYAAREGCALLLWATMPQLPEALSVMAAWGFRYRTVAFTWVKLTRTGTPCFGLGHYTRSNAEVCLLGTCGTVRRQHADVPQVILAPRRQHSRKPDEQYARIMRLFAGPYCEVFARTRWPGWDVAYSDQADRFSAGRLALASGG